MISTQTYPAYVHPVQSGTIGLPHSLDTNQTSSLPLPTQNEDYKIVRFDIERLSTITLYSLFIGCKRVIDGLHTEVQSLKTNEKNLGMHVADQKAEIHALSLLANALANASRHSNDDLIGQLNDNLTVQKLSNRIPGCDVSGVNGRTDGPNSASICEQIDNALRNFVRQHPFGFEIVRLTNGIYTINGDRVRLTWNGTQPLITVGLETVLFSEYVNPLITSIKSVSNSGIPEDEHLNTKMEKNDISPKQNKISSTSLKEKNSRPSTGMISTHPPSEASPKVNSKKLKSTSPKKSPAIASKSSSVSTKVPAKSPGRNSSPTSTKGSTPAAKSKQVAKKKVSDRL